MKLLLLTWSFFIICATVVSQCPSRRDIYPCICLDKKVGKKKYEIIVICQRIQQLDTFANIESRLITMDIEKFLLYDSFWLNSGAQAAFQQTFPQDFVHSYRVKELEIVDTILSPVFACPSTPDCRDSKIIKMTAINSSLSESSFQPCPSTRSGSWLNCLKRLKYLKIAHGQLGTIKEDFFSARMNELDNLILPFNRISRIEKKVFNSETFPKLAILDLSHNNLRDVKNLFSTNDMKITFLDLSYNFIRSLFMFKNLPNLKKVVLYKNELFELHGTDWQNAPTLRYVDLRENALNCDCNFQWINETFHINTELIGSCSKPKEVASMNLRKASRLLKLRCDDGNIGKSRRERKGKN